MKIYDDKLIKVTRREFNIWYGKVKKRSNETWKDINKK